MAWRVPPIYARALRYALVAVGFHLLWPRLLSVIHPAWRPSSPSASSVLAPTSDVDFAWGSILHRFQNNPKPSDKRAPFPWSPTTTFPRRSHPLQVLIVTSELDGLHKNGGIGTAFSELALALAEDNGLNVSVLVAHEEKNYLADQVVLLRSSLAARGVALAFVEAPNDPFFPEAYTPTASMWVQRYLRSHDLFDIIHFPDNTGIGYFSALSKLEGRMLQDTKLVVGLHGAEVEWAAMLNKRYPTDRYSAQQEEFERRTAEMADAVVSPSDYMLKYVRKRGWRVPASSFVIPNVVKPPLRPASESVNATSAITELVFFGRLEERKGTKLFLESLELLLEARTPFPLTTVNNITFLGRDHPDRITHIDASTLITQALIPLQAESATDFTFGFIKDFDREEALAYLREPHRLAILPSLADNSPSTVLECIAHSIRFVAAGVGGVPELVEASYHEDALFRPLSRELASKLAGITRRGGTAMREVPRAAPATVHAARDWTNFHFWLADAKSLIGNKPLSRPDEPLVSLCITHFERIHLVPQLLESLQQQTYENFEVILVDDGSTSVEAVSGLEALEQSYFQRDNWQVLRINNSYLGEARNQAASLAQGRYLFFLDDDDVLKSHALQTLVDVAHRTNASALSSWLDEFATDINPTLDPESADVPHRRTYWFLGQSLSTGILMNCFGSGNIFVERRAFDAIGGFSTYRQVGAEDWEFYIRLALAGYSQLVVPEELIWVRSSPHRASMKFTMDPWDAGFHALIPLLNDQRIHSLGLSHALMTLKGLADAPDAPPIVGDSLHDFELVQGWNGWTYAFVPAEFGFDKFQDYLAVPQGGYWSTRGDGQSTAKISDWVLAPFYSELGVRHLAVRTFTSPKDQAVSIRFQFTGSHQCGDGTELTLYHVEGQGGESTILHRVRTKVEASDILYFDAQLSEGSMIHLVSDPLLDDRCDDVIVHLTLTWINMADASWSSLTKRKILAEETEREAKSDVNDPVDEWIPVGVEIEEPDDDDDDERPRLDFALIFDANRLDHALQVVRSATHYVLGRSLQLHAVAPVALHSDVREAVKGLKVHLHLYDHELCYHHARQLLSFSDPGIHISAHCKMFLADIMPKLSRILYLDTDTTILSDISPCYEEPLEGGALMSMAVDMGDVCQREPELCWPIGLHWRVPDGLVCGNIPSKAEESDGATLCVGAGEQEPFQVNGGVILFELERMRSSGFARRYLQSAVHHFRIMGEPSNWGEQDFINSYFRLFPGDLQLLPCGCNYQWFGQRAEVKCGDQPLYISHAWSHGIATRTANPYNILFYHFLDSKPGRPPLVPLVSASGAGSPNISLSLPQLENNVNCPSQVHSCDAPFTQRPYGEVVTLLSLAIRGILLADLVSSVESQTYRHLVHVLATREDDDLPLAKLERRVIPLDLDEEVVNDYREACRRCATTSNGTCADPPVALVERRSFFDCVCDSQDRTATFRYDLEAIAETGWILWLEEDRILTSPDAVALLMAEVDHRDQLIVFRSNTSTGVQDFDYGRKSIPRSDLGGVGFLFHSSHLELTEWDDRQCGSWETLDRLSTRLYVKWVNNVPMMQHPLWLQAIDRPADELRISVVVSESLGHSSWTKEVVETLVAPQMTALVKSVVVLASQSQPGDFGPDVKVAFVPRGSGLGEVAALVNTAGLLLLSDTVKLSKDAITAMINYWIEDPLRVIGPLTEDVFEEFSPPLWDQDDFNFYNEVDPSLGQPEYAQILPRVLLTSTSHFATLSQNYLEQGLHPACHGMVLNALATRATFLPPLRILLPEESLVDYVNECRQRRVPAVPGPQPGDPELHDGEVLESPTFAHCSRAVQGILNTENDDWLMYGSEVGVSGLHGARLGFVESSTIAEERWKATRASAPCII